MATGLTLRPSGAPVWVNCPGAPSLWASVPPDESDVARECKAARWLAEQILTGIHAGEELIDRQAPNGVFISEEMLRDVEFFCRIVTEKVYNLRVKESMTINDISEGMTGTPDAIGYDNQDSWTLVIMDLEYGWRIVEAFENWKLICYAAGIPTTPGFRTTHVEFVIVQPRASRPDGPVSRWRVSIDDLQQIYWPQLRTAAQGGNCRTGPWCPKCNGTTGCPALREATASASQFVASPIIEVYDGEQLAIELAMLEAAEISLTARIAAIREMSIERVIKRPNSVPGWMVERSNGTKHWSDGTDLEVLEKLTGVPLHKSKQLTPKQAIDAGVSESIVAQYSERSMGNAKIKRFNPTSIARKMGTVNK